MEEYHAIFAERMIQHPAVQRICNRDYSRLFMTPDNTRHISLTTEA
jgi:LysR family transcriptional activator of nhaA